MKILIRSAKIIDSSSEFNEQIKDLLIKDGIIVAIGDAFSDIDARVIEGENLHVSNGWLDLRVASRDPGQEYKEDLFTVRKVAAKGGFTEIVLLPNAIPVVHSKDTIQYIRSAGEKGTVELHVAAAVTRDARGVDFTEMMDLHSAGAIAFTDGEHSVQNADLLLKTIQYLLPLNIVLMNRPEDGQLALYGQMHEGITSTQLGMKGIPSLAEEMMVLRDLKLLEYVLKDNDREETGPLLHFSLISTAESVEHIRLAKEKGLPVTCDIASHQLAFIDEDLLGFDTNLKVSPPFRSQEDLKALRIGLADGTIDAIVSDHAPHDEESKNLEFDHADFGITGLETSFSTAMMYSGLSLQAIIAKLTVMPRYILRKSQPVIKVGQNANFTLFNPDALWVYEKSLSKSKNTPFLGKKLRGQVKGVINRGTLQWFD